MVLYDYKYNTNMIRSQYLMKISNFKCMIMVGAIILFTMINFNSTTNYAEASNKLKTPKNFKGTTELTEEYETVLAITWGKVSDADGYEVYYRSNVPGEDTWDSWYLVTKTKERKAQGGIIDGQFQMRVRAYKDSKYSDFTDVITVLGGTGIIDNPTIKLSNSKKTIRVGNKLKLKLIDTTDEVTWKSSDKKIASVSKKGVVKGLKKGTITITATHQGNKYKCKITVKNVSKKELAKNAYKDFIVDNLRKNKDYYDYYYALDDVTGDGVPELFIGTSESYKGSYSEQYFLYTYQDGKVKTLFTLNDGYSAWAVEYDKEKKYFIVVYAPRPSSWYDIYQYNGKKLKEIASTDDYAKYEKYTKKAKRPDFLKITDENLKNF